MPKGPRTIYLIKRLETLIRVRLETALQDIALTPGQYTTLSVVNVGPISFEVFAGEFFSLLGPSGYLVNTSRGPIVDEAALVEAVELLEEGLDLTPRSRLIAPGQLEPQVLLSQGLVHDLTERVERVSNRLDAVEKEAFGPNYNYQPSTPPLN